MAGLDLLDMKWMGEEPKILMTGKWNESMSYQPCDSEGEPLPGTELKEVWKLADVPKDDKYQYTHFAHKINSFDTAPKKLLPSRLRPDRYALEMGDMSKSDYEKSRYDNKILSPITGVSFAFAFTVYLIPWNRDQMQVVLKHFHRYANHLFARVIRPSPTIPNSKNDYAAI